MDYDRESLHGAYRRGRRLSAGTAAMWMETISEFLPPREGLTLLDLGCGTGRFSVVLAEHYDAEVVGVDPSDEMRRRAEPHPRVRYLAGSAEAIPCADASCDAAFLSQVVHHFPSVPAACRELARVVKLGAIVFVRNSFRNRLDTVRYYDFFPGARGIDNARLPDADAVTRAFESAGFERIAFRAVVQELDPSLRAHYERLKLRALSTFELMTEAQIVDGLEALRKAALAETEPQPVNEAIDLMVFRRRR